MTDHPSRETLSAFVDERLAGQRRGRVAEHLAECAECRSFVRRSRALMEELRSLPREIEVPRKGERPWLEGEGAPGRIPASEGGSAGRTWLLPTGAARAWMAAAAVLLLAVVSGLLVTGPWSAGPAADDPSVVTVRTGERGEGTAPVRGSPAATTVAPGGTLVPYETAAQELASVYRRRRPELPPEVSRAVEASLASLDEAIRSTAAVAERRPDAPLVRSMLVSRYERKLELLRRALDLEREG